MTTQPTHLSAAGAAATQRRSPMTVVWLLLVVVVLGTIAYHARMGAISPRIANPEVTGAPRPVEFRYGNDFPIHEMQWGTVGMMVVLIAACVRTWHKRLTVVPWCRTHGMPTDRSTCW